MYMLSNSLGCQAIGMMEPSTSNVGGGLNVMEVEGSWVSVEGRETEKVMR